MVLFHGSSISGVLSKSPVFYEFLQQTKMPLALFAFHFIIFFKFSFGSHRKNRHCGCRESHLFGNARWQDTHLFFFGGQLTIVFLSLSVSIICPVPALVFCFFAQSVFSRKTLSSVSDQFSPHAGFWFHPWLFFLNNWWENSHNEESLLGWHLCDAEQCFSDHISILVPTKTIRRFWHANNKRNTYKSWSAALSHNVNVMKARFRTFLSLSKIPLLFVNGWSLVSDHLMKCCYSHQFLMRFGSCCQVVGTIGTWTTPFLRVMHKARKPYFLPYFVQRSGCTCFVYWKNE